MASAFPIRYQDGIYLPDADLWLDPRRSRPRAFVSHAHSDHFAPHNHILCSPMTRALIEGRYSKRPNQVFTTPNWGEPHESKGYRFRLLPAGHILGSAMLYASNESDGSSLLYTGDFKLRQGLSSEPAELMAADTLVLESTFGLPKYRFPPVQEVVDKIITFVHETLKEGGIPVLLGYSLGKAQEILAILTRAGVPIMIHSSIAPLTRIYESFQIAFGDWKLFNERQAEGHALIFPPRAARSVTLRNLRGVRTAMLSGWALDKGAKYRYQVDEVFPLSDHADYDELLECVARVNPQHIFTVHGFASEFARDLRERGYDAWSLVSENQLELPLFRRISPLQ